MLDIVVVSSLDIEVECDISVLDPHPVLGPNATAIQGQHVRSVVRIVLRAQTRSDLFCQKSVHSEQLDRLVIAVGLLFIVLVYNERADFFQVLRRI